MKRRTIATVLLLVFVLSGQASAFSFFSKKSIKEMEDKVVEILMEPEPAIHELNFKVHSVEAHYDSEKKMMLIDCKAVPVSRPHNWIKQYLYLKIPKLYGQIPKLDVIDTVVLIPKEGYYGYMLKRDDCTWLAKLAFRLSRETYEKTDWKHGFNLLSLYGVFDQYRAAP